MRNSLCEFLTFAGGAKLECKHSSLAYAFRAKKYRLNRFRSKRYLFLFHITVSSSSWQEPSEPSLPCSFRCPYCTFECICALPPPTYGSGSSTQSWLPRSAAGHPGFSLWGLHGAFSSVSLSIPCIIISTVLIKS